jgi:multiple sugar transport system permease protein
MKSNRSNNKSVSYERWGYIFILPFFVTFLVFSLIPLVDTIRYSFYEYYRSGLIEVGPNFVGLENYKALLESDLLKYAGNTFIMWIAGFIPQIGIAMLLAAWFTDHRIRIHGLQFFKVVIYLPNLIMASAFAMLFFTLFSDAGPINQILMSTGLIHHNIRFMVSTLGARSLIALMNFLMWFGNTAIMLMAAIMGINPALFEAAELDGCNHAKIFRHVTLPLIRPILAYTLITSIIGGLQMYDVPQILTNGKGTPAGSTITVIMNLNQYLTSKNFGMGGALSVFMFIVTGILSLVVFRINSAKE